MKILLERKSNYRVIRRVHKYLYTDIADIFFEYDHSLDPDEIQELDGEMKANGLSIKKILEIDNASDMLSNFQLFYYNTGRFPLSNKLIIVPDGDVPDGEEKINMKNLYEMFQHTKSHGLVSLQFLEVFCLIFDNKEIKRTKNARTELYKNLSYTTLSGAQNFEFNAISELVGRMSSLIKGSTLLKRDKRELEDAQKAKEIIDKTKFVDKRDPFEQELINNFFKELEHKKTQYPYVEPQVQDPQTIETETQAVNDEFAQLKQEFDKVNDAATEQKIQTGAINLIDGILNENNLFRNVNTDDIWIEDNLFDNNDRQNVKNVSKEIIHRVIPVNDIIYFDDDVPTANDTDIIPFNHNIPIQIDNDFPTETVATKDDIHIPSDNRKAIDVPKK